MKIHTYNALHECISQCVVYKRNMHSLLPKDERNNAVVGENVRMYECNNCIVHTPHLKQAVIQGLDGYIIAEKEGTLLICRLAEEQRIKEFSKA